MRGSAWSWAPSLSLGGKPENKPEDILLNNEPARSWEKQADRQARGVFSPWI